LLLFSFARLYKAGKILYNVGQELEWLFASFAAKARKAAPYCCYGEDYAARAGSSAPAGAAKGRRPLESRSLCKGWRNFYLRFAPF